MHDEAFSTLYGRRLFICHLAQTAHTCINLLVYPTHEFFD